MNYNQSASNQKQENLIISPETKIGKLLDAYPHLEDLLWDISPEFAKLRNPILRNTIAKVATLKQAAEIVKIPLEDFINQLRQAVGQSNWTGTAIEITQQEDMKPDWISSGEIAVSIDARPMLDKGEHPIDLVLKKIENLNENQILELFTPFQPQPLIDLLRSKGYQTWTNAISAHLYKTYIKP